MSTDFIGYLYAATVAAGGIMGYVKAGKKKNLHCVPFMLLKIIIYSRFFAIIGSWSSIWGHFR